MKELDAIDALRTGFFTNALNPKTTLFVVSVYTQIVQPETSIAVQVGYGLFMSLAHWVWFSLVTVFFSEEHLRSKMLQHQIVLNRMIGAILASLGFWLAFSPK
jgi:threonine/homoserine/homoserine lactone efflux protein